MARSLSLWLVCGLLAGALAVASAQKSGTHYGGGYAPRVGALSVWNPATKHYEPVTSDRQYTYYRLKINLDLTFADSFRAKPPSPSLVSLVASGNVYDSITGAMVGTWDSSHISTVFTDKKQQQYMSNVALELGPDGDSTIFIQSSHDRANTEAGFGPITDHDGAVTGGTGRYKGATGENLALFVGSEVVGPETTYVIELAVPRFKRF